MKLDLFFITDYLHGKPIYHVARRILNLIFSISISSFLFEKFYFKYVWLDVTDYKGILDFLIKGYFFVPFCIFIIVHYCLEWFSHIVHSLIVSLKAIRMKQWIYEIEFRKSDARKMSKAINNNPVYRLPEKVNESWFFDLYQHIINAVPTEQLLQMEAELEKGKQNNEKNFQFAIKALLTITVYFFIVPYFGWKLYFIVVIVLCMILLALYWGYLLMEVAPFAARKFHNEVLAYLQKVNEQNENRPSTEKRTPK